MVPEIAIVLMRSALSVKAPAVLFVDVEFVVIEDPALPTKATVPPGQMSAELAPSTVAEGLVGPEVWVIELEVATLLPGPHDPELFANQQLASFTKSNCNVYVPSKSVVYAGPCVASLPSMVSV